MINITNLKIGDKVVCIDVGKNFYLTLGKTYEVVYAYMDYIYVISDDDTEYKYCANMFMTLKEHRRLKLERLSGTNL